MFRIRLLLCGLCMTALLVALKFVEAGSAIQPCYNHPNMTLPVPFLCQYGPPGDPTNTKNCGQTCSSMLQGYYQDYCPASTTITNENRWLATRFKDSRYNDPNGYYTHFNDGRNSLGTLLREYCRLNYWVGNGKDITSVLDQLKAGFPVIVGVQISGGQLVSSGGSAHWALAVGWDGRNNQIILNDPGTKGGRQKPYSVADFEKSWATQNRIYAPVSR